MTGKADHKNKCDLHTFDDIPKYLYYFVDNPLSPWVKVSCVIHVSFEMPNNSIIFVKSLFQQCLGMDLFHLKVLSVS